DVALAGRDGDELAVWAGADAERPGLHGDARGYFGLLDDAASFEGSVEVHDRDVFGPSVAGDQVGLAVAAVREGETFGIRPATEVMGVDIGKERLPVRDLRRLRWRKEGDREECAALPQLARAPAGERHLDLAANASGPSIEKADAIRAVFGQPAFRVSGDDQARDDKDSHAAEPAGVEIVLERRVGVVELALEHLSDVHDRDVRAAAVLQE